MTERAAACPHALQILAYHPATGLIYVRAIREGNFQLYIEALTKIVPWFFALDHTWIPVHLCDMVSLNDCHPDIYAEFMKGKFTVKNSKHAFSANAID
jgi:hypothetical protein